MSQIQKLVASVNGDLEGLEADQFIAARDNKQKIIGCARLKPYPGFCELASLAVAEEWRSSGIGREIVTRLMESHQGTVYLICEDNVVDFFRRFDFVLIPMSEAFPQLEPKIKRYIAEAGHINVMRRN